MAVPAPIKVIAIAVLTVTALAAGMLTASYMQTPQRPAIEGLLWPQPKQLAPFELTASDGSTLDRTRLEGRWTFLFFGYTYCPDVCPNTLASMAQVMKSLRSSGDAADAQVVFVSVDPARDTRERLHEYVTYFDPAFVGASSDDDQRLVRMTRDLGVLYVRGEPDTDGRYEVDHTASVMLVDPQARLVGVLSAPHVPDTMAQRFREIRSFVESAS